MVRSMCVVRAHSVVANGNEQTQPPCRAKASLRCESMCLLSTPSEEALSLRSFPLTPSHSLSPRFPLTPSLSVAMGCVRDVRACSGDAAGYHLVGGWLRQGQGEQGQTLGGHSNSGSSLVFRLAHNQTCYFLIVISNVSRDLKHLQHRARAWAGEHPGVGYCSFFSPECCPLPAF